MKTETRSITTTFRSDDERFELVGVVAPYNSPTDVGGAFTEQIAPGAFTRALREKQDVRALVNHDENQVLGRVGNGTLVLSDSPEGLRCVIKLNRESQAHRDLYASVKRGDVHEMSFAFKPTATGEKWERRKGVQLRTLTDVDLFDASVVTRAQYSKGTSVSARAAGADGKALDEYHRKRLNEIEVQVLLDAPGYRYTTDERGQPCVRAMTQAEVDARADAANAIRVLRAAKEIARDRVKAEIEEVREELGL